MNESFVLRLILLLPYVTFLFSLSLHVVFIRRKDKKVRLQVILARDKEMIKNYISKMYRNKNISEDNFKADFTEIWIEDVDCDLLVWDRILLQISVKIILKN
jgi:hypothetical protein